MGGWQPHYRILIVILLEVFLHQTKDTQPDPICLFVYFLPFACMRVSLYFVGVFPPLSCIFVVVIILLAFFFLFSHEYFHIFMWPLFGFLRLRLLTPASPTLSWQLWAKLSAADCLPSSEVACVGPCYLIGFCDSEDEHQMAGSSAQWKKCSLKITHSLNFKKWFACVK